MTRYTIALIVVIASIALDLMLTRPGVPPTTPLLFVAVLLSAFWGGLGPGLVAAVAAMLADNYFFVPPLRSIDFNLASLVRMGLFLSVAPATSYLTSRWKRAVAERDAVLASESAARTAAEAATQVRDRFLAVASHELRGPLSAIGLWADVLAGESLSAIGHEAADGIRDGVRAQERLLEDLLDGVRTAAGKLRLDRQPVDLAGVVRSAMAAVEPRAAERQVDLSVGQAAGGAAATVYVDGDPVRLGQVVTNLLTNAVKFTPAGGQVRLTLGTDGTVATLRVADTGRGIDPADLPRVFDRYWQAGGATATAAAVGDGLGLGLSIVSEIVRLHGGRVSAASDGPGRGTTFTVELPLLATASAGG